MGVVGGRGMEVDAERKREIKRKQRERERENAAKYIKAKTWREK